MTTTYEVVDKVTNEVVYAYGGTAPAELGPYTFDRYIHRPVISEVTPDRPTVYGGRRLVTPREFRDLFTEDEKNAIDKLEDTFQTMELPVDVTDRIRTGFKDYHAALDINLDEPRVPMLLGVFVGFGCISFDRIAEVLNG